MVPPLPGRGVVYSEMSKTPQLSSTAQRANAADIRTQLVKDQMAQERAALDAKTARLRALRLAKEAEDAATAATHPAPAKPRRKRIT